MSKKIKFNKSKTYLLPLISDYIKFNPKYLSNLKNTYLRCDKYKEKDYFFMLHDFNSEDENFTAYEHELMSSKLFIEAHDINNQVLYVFKFPKQHMKDYNTFLQSKYSKLKEESKHLILGFWDNIYKNNPNALNFLSKVKNILYKESKLKNELELKLNVTISDDAELGEFIDVNNETFKFSEINKLNEN